MRAFWIAIGIAMLVCTAMCCLYDWLGDEELTMSWGAALFGLMIVALVAYGMEYRLMEPPAEREYVAEQPLEWRD